MQSHNQNDNLLVKFNNDDRYYVLEDFMYEHYEKSLFVLSQKFKKTGYIALENMNYEQFKPVFEFLKGNLNNFQEIRLELDYLGIINNEIDFVNQYEQNMEIKQNNKINKLFQFINGKNKVFLVKSFEDYKQYKQMLKTNQNIVPIQFMITINENSERENIPQVIQLTQLCIFDCIPIYGDSLFGEYFVKVGNDLNIDHNGNNEEVPISIIRVPMHYALKCENKEQYYSKKKYTCLIKSNAKDLYDENVDKMLKILNNKKIIHTTDEMVYLKELMRLVFNSTGKYYEAWKNNIKYDLMDMEAIVDTQKFNTPINIQKLSKTIELIERNNIKEIIMNLNHKKNVAYTDYVVAPILRCPGTCFWTHANLYFGFVNLK